MKNIFLATIVTLKTAFVANISFAETWSLYSVTECSETETLFNNISKRYQETPLANGVGSIQYFNNQEQIESNAGIFTFWVNQDSGTFAVTLTFRDGVSCLLTEGIGFEPYTGPLPDRPRN